MNIKRNLFAMLLLIVGAVLQLSAQSPVTKGDQVTSEASLEEGVPYIIYQPRNNTYVKEASDRYSAIKDNSPDDAGVFYFVKVSDGVYKIKSHSTGKYISKPTTTGIAAIAPVEEASAGEWNLQYDSNGCIYPLCNGYGWDRGSEALWATAGASTTYSESGNVKLYKIYKVALSTTAFSEFTDKDVTLSSTAATSLTTGTWYVMKNMGRNGYLYEKTASHSLYNQAAAPSGSAPGNAQFLVRLVSGDDGKYYIQNGLGNYFGAIPQNITVPMTAVYKEQISITQIGSNAGYFYLRGTTDNRILDCQENGKPVVGWGIDAPTTTNSNAAWQFFPVTLVDSWVPTINEVYTINNTNDSRGAITYEPNKSSTNVWSSGKSGATAFDATNPNHQWVIVPTATAKQYYLYNVGAGKFAIPTGIDTGTGYPWVFSDNAVAVQFILQSDGTKKIQMVTSPVSGTNYAYISVSNGHTNPVFNYNDDGSKFTITLVDGQDQSAAANAAVEKLVKSQTALTTYPSTSGWYAIQIKSKTGSASYAGRFLQNSTTLYNNLYPLTFTGGVDVQPAITDPTFITYINCTSWNVNTWQLPDGRYLVDNGSNKFPTPSATAGNVICGYDNGNYFKTNSNYYADPYNSNANYFIGETTSMRTAYTVYPIDLAAAGLTAWKVTINNASPTTTLACTRSDVSGLTAVYNNGYFFLPTGTTPESGDFSLTGMLSCAIDADLKTITAEYNPELSLLISDVKVNQGNQTTGKGNTMQALLRIKATPFNDFQPTKFIINLSGADQVDNVKVYSTSSDQIRFAGVTPTLLGTNASPSEGSMEINVTSESVSAGTSMYYWVTADVKSTATEWGTIDASLSSISYTNAYKTAGSLADTELDLSSIGNPDGKMRIYKQQSELWTASMGNTQYYRIPTIMQTTDGGIIALTDNRHNNSNDLGSHKIDVVARKSMDNGLTWGDEITVAVGDGSSDAAYGYGDPAIVRTLNGKLICLMAAGKASYSSASGQLHMGYSESTDNGATWSAPVDIYSSIIKPDGVTFQSVFTTAGKGVTFSNGRVAYAMNGKVNGTTNEYIIYSDDEGATWKLSTSAAFTGADESKLEIMNDNSLLVSVRCGSYNYHANRGYNRTTGDASGDGINSWGTQGNWGSEMYANGCNADMMYYNRETENAGRPDVIFHTLTKTYSTYRKDLRLYMSFDQGTTWKEAFQLQPGWAAYSSMQKLANGDLAIIFEDGSIGNEDKQDCYAIDYVVLSSDIVNAKIDELIHHPIATVISQGETNGSAPWGTWSPTSGWANTFTTNASAGVAGVVVSANYNAFNRQGGYDQRVFLIKPSAAGAQDEITITAPAGYCIDGYTIGGYFGTSSETYRLTSENGSYVDINKNKSQQNPPTYLTTSGLNAKSTTITFSNSNSTNNSSAFITNFTVTLADVYSVNLNTVGDASYATLYLPFDVITDADTKAYYISNTSNGYATLTEVEDNEIAANTAVLLINEARNTAEFSVTSGLTQQISETDNHLKGTLVPMTLDLGSGTSFYALGKKNDKIGFYKFDNSSTTSITLGANKAYLETPAQASEARGFEFDFDGSSTGIDSMYDGQGTMYDGQGTMYDLSGRRVESLKRGIYIVNGKKIIK